jgi:hypothetical protein
MKAKCIQAVSQAINRQITQAEAAGIEQRIMRNMRAVAAKDPAAFSRMTPAMRLQQAAQLAGQELIKDAQLKLRRVQLSIEAHDRLETYINDQVAGGMDRLDALRRTLVFNADGKSNTLSAESRGNAIRANSIRQLIDTFEAVDPRFFGLLESEEGVRILTKAIFGEKTGNAVADKGAKAWTDVADQLREQFNNAGGKIRELENWALPQHHSQLKVAKAGRDAWTAAVFPMLNRRRYLRDDGLPMSDSEVVQFLHSAWESIATGGINQMTPGAPGQSMLANRRAFAREIHYKDADSYLAYQQQFGEQSLWGVITGHVEGLSKEIAMLETYGPNADRSFSVMLEKQLQAKALDNPEATTKAEMEARRLANLYDFVSGRTQPVVNEHLAQTFDTLRNWLVSSRLGSAVITALTDEATIHLTANINKLPEMQLLANELAALNPANQTEKNLALRAGLAIDTMIGELNRWGQDNLGPTFSSKMASTVMRASGMNALDGARRRAFGVTMMSSLGEIAGKYKTLKDIDPADYRILLSKGITAENFQVWKLAQLEQWGAGNGVLTPESIMRIPDADLVAAGFADATVAKREAVLRLLGVVLEETDMAVIRPGAADKFLTGAGMERGTWKGELTRSFFLFKSFPLAMIARHWMRGMGMETAGGKAGYIASLVVGTTVLGAASQTINDLLQGKNPRNYNPFEGEYGARNWMAAMLKGGSLGIYGDFLFSGATQHGNTGPIASLLGPVAGLVEEAFNLTQGNIIQAMQGKDTKFGAEAVKFIRGNLPGANLWYTKAAMDHLIFHQLQEYFSPGYLATMQRRAQREFGQTYFWQPGTGLDGMRAPDFEKAIGE